MENEKKRAGLVAVLEKHGVGERYMSLTVTALESFLEEVKATPKLTAPARFKEVSTSACNKELLAIKQQARKLRGLVETLSHTAATELFYSAGWQRSSDLVNELSGLIDAAQEMEITANPLAPLGRPQLDVPKRLVAFLRNTWEQETGRTATTNSWQGSNKTFLCFVKDVFEHVEIKKSTAARFVKNEVSSKDKTTQ